MLIVVYGPEQQASILKSILATHGIVLDSIYTVFEADDTDEEHTDTEQLAPPTLRTGGSGDYGDGSDMILMGGTASNLIPFGMSNRRATGSFTSLVGSSVGRPAYSTEFKNYVRQTQATSQEAMRQQIDELFASFKSFEELPETEPSMMTTSSSLA